MPPNNEIEDFRSEIFEAGMHLASLISAAFPDAYTVSMGVACVLGVVEQYGLVGKWVTACIKHTGEYMITKQIRDVSIIAFSVFSTMHFAIFKPLSFRQTTLQAVIDCVAKSYECFETNPSDWRDVNSQCLELLSERDLERYCDQFPNEENCQDEWRAAITHEGKYVNLLAGQKTDEDVREENDEENYYDNEPWEQVTKNSYLAYHQVKAHARWLESRPDEAEHYNRFQVRNSHLILYV